MSKDPQAAAPRARSKQWRWMLRLAARVGLYSVAAVAITLLADDLILLTRLGAPYRFEDPEQWAPIFEAESRDAYQLPERVLATLELRPGMRVADVGAATGYFSVRLAHAVGPAGRVYAVDIEEDLLAYTAARARGLGLENVQTVVATPEHSRLEPDCCDLILMVNTYYLIKDRVGYLVHLKGRLRGAGRIAIIDWLASASDGMGPEERHKVSAQQVGDELAAAGFVIRMQSSLPYQHFTLAQVPQDPGKGDGRP